MPKTEARAGSADTGSKVIAFLTRRWIAIVLIIVGVVFILQNRNYTTVQLFFAQVNLPQWMALLGVFLLGLIAGVLIVRNRRGGR